MFSAIEAEALAKTFRASECEPGENGRNPWVIALAPVLTGALKRHHYEKLTSANRGQKSSSKQAKNKCWISPARAQLGLPRRGLLRQAPTCDDRQRSIPCAASALGRPSIRSTHYLLYSTAFFCANSASRSFRQG